MSQESGEKTEEPTSKRLSDARKEGQLPQRKNVMEALLILSGFIAIIYSLAPMQSLLLELFDSVFLGISSSKGFLREHGSLILSKFLAIGAFIVIFVGGISICIILVGLFLNGFNLSMKSLNPKFEKLNPVNGIKAIFSKNTFYNFVRSFSYMILVTTVWFFVIYYSIDDYIYSFECGPNCLGRIIIEGALILLISVCVIQLALALFDFKIQNVIFKSQMKMTKDAVKREYKQNEGDPLIKGARKEQAHEDQYLPSLLSFTHVVYSNSRLVAIIFDPNSGVPPFVILKAKDKNVTKTLMRLKNMKRSAHFLCLPAVAKHFYEVGKNNNYVVNNIAPQLAELVIHSQKEI